MSRDEGEYPIVAWTAQRDGRTAICVCVPPDSGFTTAEELTFAPDGLLPSVARDRNGDAWIAWWKFFDGIFWAHTYVTATAHSVTVQGTPAARTVSWTLSEPAPETWWAVLRAPSGGDFVEVARVRATPDLDMSWTDASAASGLLRYRVRRESVDKRYEWLSDEVVWDGPVPAALSLLSVDVTPERVTLTWHGPGADGLDAAVERRTEETDWQMIGNALPAGIDRLRYEDSTVASGTRYGYRLRYSEDGATLYTSASWIEVPPRPTLSLEGFQPNPSREGALVAFALPASGRSVLEVLDVGGRRVFHRSLVAFGAGRHTVRIDSSTALAPGVYLIRLTHGDRSLTARGVIVR
jgi:hypothetical protein